MGADIVSDSCGLYASNTENKLSRHTDMLNKSTGKTSFSDITLTFSPLGPEGPGGPMGPVRPCDRKHCENTFKTLNWHKNEFFVLKLALRK